MKSLHIDLMAESWINGRLPDEKGCPFGLSEDDKKIWLKIKHKWILENDLWYNDKLELERDKKSKFIEHQVVNGKKGGRPKNPNGNPNKTQALSEIEAKGKPLVNCKGNSNVLESLGKKEDSNARPIEIPEIGSELVAEIARKVWEDQRWRESVCMGNSWQPEELKKWMGKFNASVCNDRIANFSAASYKKMIQGWVSVQVSRGVTLNAATQPNRSSNSAPLQRFNQ